MHKVKFSKVSNNHNRLRDDVIVGECEKLPELNKPFIMYCDPRDTTEGFRVVNTSRIKEMSVEFSKPNIFDVHTESGSHYKIEVLED